MSHELNLKMIQNWICDERCWLSVMLKLPSPPTAPPSVIKNTHIVLHLSNNWIFKFSDERRFNSNTWRSTAAFWLATSEHYNNNKTLNNNHISSIFLFSRLISLSISMLGLFSSRSCVLYMNENFACCRILIIRCIRMIIKTDDTFADKYIQYVWLWAKSTMTDLYFILFLLFILSRI